MTRDDWLVLLFGAVIGGLIVIATGTVVHAAPAQCGIASRYGAESGSRTANGERFPTSEPTAASPWLPFGARVRVTDIASGRSVVVRVNDRGPARWTHRIIDLSPVAARALGMGGLAKVCLSPK